MSLVVRATRFSNGERYRLLVDPDTGLPLYYPNLYVTSQIRNRSLAVATMEAVLTALKHFHAYCDEETLEARVRNRDYFSTEELDAIRDHCQLATQESEERASYRAQGVLSLPVRAPRRVSKAYQYSRLSAVASYVEWLVPTIHGSGVPLADREEAVRVANGLRARRPRYRRQGLLGAADKALSEEARHRLREVIEPTHALNPFRDPGIAERNYLIVKLAADLGVRSGELLGTRISDIDFREFRLTVHRRADDRDDSRLNEPNAKTLARTLPIGRGLIQRLTTYVTGVRSTVPNAGRNEFLFVSHKQGPTQGQPLSKESLKQVFKRIAESHPALHGVHPHALRHSWNDEFSKRLDALPSERRPSEAEEAQMRDHLMGWKQGSGTSAAYNTRHIKRQADAASRALQEKLDEGTDEYTRSRK